VAVGRPGFLLNGWDVSVFDPDPEAPRKIEAVLANAMRMPLPALWDVPMPAMGRLTYATSLAEAVTDADYIQESVSERLDLKHRVYAEIQNTCAGHAAGILNIRLQALGIAGRCDQSGQDLSWRIRSTRFTCCPWPRWCPARQRPKRIDRTVKDILRGIGMFPLHVRKEIDAHIADRFLEAVWREALVAGQGRHRHDRGNRRGDPHGLWPALGADGPVRDLPHRGRRGGDEAFPGAVRPLPDMAMDQADGCARIQR
jgi:carnitine 3-dehydrogenase